MINQSCKNFLVDAILARTVKNSGLFSSTIKLKDDIDDG